MKYIIITHTEYEGYYVHETDDLSGIELDEKVNELNRGDSSVEYVFSACHEIKYKPVKIITKLERE